MNVLRLIGMGFLQKYENRFWIWVGGGSQGLEAKG